MSIQKIKVIKVDDSNRDRIKKKPGGVYYDTGDDSMFIRLADNDAEMVMAGKYIEHLAMAGAFPDWVKNRCLVLRKQCYKVGYRKPYDVYQMNQDTKEVIPGRMYLTDDCMLCIAMDKCGIPGMDTEVYPVSPDELTDLLTEGLMPEWVMQKFANTNVGARH